MLFGKGLFFRKLVFLIKFSIFIDFRRQTIPKLAIVNPEKNLHQLAGY